MSFQNLGLTEPVVHGAQRMRYVEPTPIQEKAIPVILEGKDIIGSAQTGTGKTAAFALPCLSLLQSHGAPIRCLILEPTRELAIQVDESFRDLGHFTNIETGLVYGGVGFEAQKKALAKCDVIVATPGRLLDHLSRGAASLSGVQILILDEVDRMLDMGFLPDVRRIIEQCPKARQTLFFSATIPAEIAGLSSWCLRDPKHIEIGISRSPAETVQHAFYPVATEQKFDLLCEILKRTDYHSVLVFTRTKMGADRITTRLKKEKHSVAVMHADRSQSERIEALDGFKKGKYEVLVATDIAARGIDVAGVSHVVNYDVPQHPEDYVHRIGRTGRAESSGDAFTIMVAEEYNHVRAIENFIGRKVPRRKLEGFDYLFTTMFDETAAAAAVKDARGVRTLKGTTFGKRRRGR